MKKHLPLILLAVAFQGALTARADTFASGASAFDIEFIPIGNPRNPPDTAGNPNPAGRVDYHYRVGKYEISREIITKANDAGGLDITLDPMDSVPGGPRAAMPATGVTWFEAARFVNWLNVSTGHSAAYKFDSDGAFQMWRPGDAGYNPANLYRNSDAFYFLPSVDEWYKAAFFDPAAGVYYPYSTGSNAVPSAVAGGTMANTAVYGQSGQGPADVTLAGGLSPYGTMSQGGNVWEWEETEYDLVNDTNFLGKGLRGGFWGSSSNTMGSSARGTVTPGYDFPIIGFRVASVPEPSSLLLGLLAGAGLLFRNRHIRRGAVRCLR